jgi:hypothetical protein
MKFVFPWSGFRALVHPKKIPPDLFDMQVLLGSKIPGVDQVLLNIPLAVVTQTWAAALHTVNRFRLASDNFRTTPQRECQCDQTVELRSTLDELWQN